MINSMINNCYFVSHLGLGDNITMSSAVRYLTHYYDNVYVIVKDIHLENLKLFYEDNKKVILVHINSKNEVEEIKKIINNLNYNVDIFISGMYQKIYFKNRIRNKKLNEKICNNNNNNNKNFKYNFIVDFYTDINLDFSIYYNYYILYENNISIELYNKVKDYKLIFLHTKSSNKEIEIDVNEYINNNKYLVICVNKNMYNKDSKEYEIANLFVNILIIYYASIIKNAHIIKVIDSCFSCMILPLLNKNHLKADNVEIINR